MSFSIITNMNIIIINSIIFLASTSYAANVHVPGLPGNIDRNTRRFNSGQQRYFISNSAIGSPSFSTGCTGAKDDDEPSHKATTERETASLNSPTAAAWATTQEEEEEEPGKDVRAVCLIVWPMAAEALQPLLKIR
jgi:hypothetical protein